MAIRASEVINNNQGRVSASDVLMNKYKAEQEKPMSDNKPILPATGDEGLGAGLLKSAVNVPSSALKLGKSVVDAVVHPKRTISAVKDVVAGAGGKVAELAFEHTDVGQSILKKMSEQRVAQGLQPLQEVDGKLQVVDTPELLKFKQLGEYVKERYGSTEALKKTAIEDPVGVLADLSSVLTGTGAVIGTAGKVADISKVAEAGNVISKVGATVEPLSLAGKTAGALKNSTLGRTVADAIPTVDKVRSGEIVKALDLTQSDVSNIKKLTGNEPSEYILSNKVAGKTPEEIASSLNTIRKDTMVKVRDEIGKVQTVYQSADVPNVQKGLKVILKGVDKVPGLEDVASQIKALATKTEYTLSDIQLAKELIDKNSNIYSKIGDVKSASQARGLDNIRKDIKGFIEDEVETATNGETNIRALNNDVQTSYAIEDAINNRATRQLTRQGISVFDGLLGLGGTAIAPGLGIAVVATKKLLETPTFRIALARTLNAQPVAKLKAITAEIASKNLSPRTIGIIKEAVQSVKDNAGVIESGSNALQETKE